jgi:hypothetical protein
VVSLVDRGMEVQVELVTSDDGQLIVHGRLTRLPDGESLEAEMEIGQFFEMVTHLTDAANTLIEDISSGKVLAVLPAVPEAERQSQ